MKPTIPPVPRLFVRPEYSTYSKAEEGRLRDDLDDLTKYTLAQEVGERRELRLDEFGMLPDGYRFTSTGYKQVCNLISPGLFTYTREISGVDRDAESDRDQYDFAEAVRTYNRALSLRFARFEGSQRLLRHTKRRLVEGVLGPRYTLVENSEILGHADQAAGSRAGNLKFHEASLYGRRLMLRYVARAKLFSASAETGIHNDKWHDGLHFANSEVGGESTFRAAVLLWRAHCDTFAMGPFLGGRKVHSGRHFQEKLARVFASAAQFEQDAGWLLKRVILLRTMAIFPKLGVVADEQTRRNSVRRVVSQLHENGVPITAAERALAIALHGHAGAGLDDYATTMDASSRTWLDLFGALTNQGRALYATAGEAVEQAAYALLTGRFQLT